MRQLEPRSRERVRERLRVLVEASRDLLVRRIEPERQIRREHVRCDLLRRVVRARDRTGTSATLRLPLLGAGRTLGQLPLVLEEVLEVIVAPLRRRRGPGDLDTARGGVGSHTGLVAALPTETLLLEVTALRFWAEVRHGGCGAMRLAERVSAGNQCHGFFVVH